jgi:hypothetical protein
MTDLIVPEHPDGHHEQKPMRTPRRERENTTAKAAADRAAIERWESEGGTALDHEQSAVGAGPGASSRPAEEDANPSFRAVAADRRESSPDWLVP